MFLLDELDRNKLLKFLMNLKDNNWLVCKDDFYTIMELHRWYDEIYGEKEVNDIRNTEMVLYNITKKLCEYIKLTEGKSKKCIHCKNIKDIKSFKGKKKEYNSCIECRDRRRVCYKKIYENGVTKYVYRTMRVVTEHKCTRCGEICISGFKTCDVCRTYNRNKYNKYFNKKKQQKGI